MLRLSSYGRSVQVQEIYLNYVQCVLHYLPEKLEDVWPTLTAVGHYHLNKQKTIFYALRTPTKWVSYHGLPRLQSLCLDTFSAHFCRVVRNNYTVPWIKHSVSRRMVMK